MAADLVGLTTNGSNGIFTTLPRTQRGERDGVTRSGGYRASVIKNGKMVDHVAHIVTSGRIVNNNWIICIACTIERI